MKLRLLCAVLMMLTLLAVGSPAAVEVDLLTNGDFENEGWSISIWNGEGEGKIVEGQAHGGAKSLYMMGKDNTTIVAQRTFAVLCDDQPVVLRGYWKGQVTKGTGGRIILRWLDEAGKQVADSSGPTKSGTFDWTLFESTFKPPTGAAKAILFLEIWETTGEVFYDDIQVVQQFEPVVPREVVMARHKGDIRAAVFDANHGGGKCFGTAGIHEDLFRRRGIEADIIADVTLATLVKYDVVVLPNVHVLPGGKVSEVLAASPEIAWMSDMRAGLSAYVRMGGGLILTHQSCGQGAFSIPLTPSIASVIDKTYDIKATWFADHPVTKGLKPFASGFSDSRILAAGPRGQVIMKNGSGHVLAVAGEIGGGKVVAIGMCPGIGTDEQPTAVTPGEADLMANAVKWAAATEVQPVMVIVSPNVVTVTEPEEPLEFTMAVVPTGRRDVGELGLEVALVGEKQRLAPSSMADLEGPADSIVMRVTFPTDKLTESEYYIEVKNSMATYDEPDNAGTVKYEGALAKIADALPKSNFEWACMNVHGPAQIKTEADAVEMAKMAKEMHFDAVLYNAKPPNGYQYYNTKIGEKPAGFENVDPLALVVKACHDEGLQLLVQFCTFAEGSTANPSKLIREHPDWADWNQGDGPDLSKHEHGIFGCPDRREVRDYELSLIREMCENYDIDGISFDYIRYKNDRWCYCPFSIAQFQEWHKQHPELSESQARSKHAEEAIVSFTWEVRELLDEFDRPLIMHGYCHPRWANRFPLEYLSFRASAHGKDPARGGGWSLEKVQASAQNNVKLAAQHKDFEPHIKRMVAAPMADTAYLDWAKSPDRFRRELRLISDAGAPAVMIYLYSTLRHKPELRAAIAAELAD